VFLKPWANYQAGKWPRGKVSTPGKSDLRHIIYTLYIIDN
jgi:hypothetical protein